MLIKDVLLPSVTLDKEVLLAHILGKGRDFFVSHSDELLSDELWQQFIKLWHERQEGLPLAYLIHEKEFYGLSFYVDERVLIPRPETELLIEIMTEKLKVESGKWKMKRQKLKVKSQKFYIADVGTGSGCIAITLAKLFPEISITALDISREALVVAKINAEKHDVGQQIQFRHSNLLDKVLSEPFDIIIANLPYIGSEKYSYIEPAVAAYEPEEALFAGKDGLELYRKLFKQIRSLPIKPRYVIGEFGFGQGEEMRSIVRSCFPEEELEIRRDLAGIERAFIINFQ